MKKFIAFMLCAALSAVGLTVGIVSAGNGYPEGRVYNYLESINGRIIVSLDDYLAAWNVNGFTVYKKADFESYPLADSVFDINKQVNYMLDPSGNTAYYLCRDRQTGCITYYAFDLDTCEKKKLYTDSTVAANDGFLGADEVLGLALSVNNTMSVMMGGGSGWINSDGIHDADDTRTRLNKYDPDGEYGVFDSMFQIAETDDYVYFRNFFSELVRFDKKTHEFKVMLERLIVDFFVMPDCIYYTSEENEVSSLYRINADSEETYIGEASVDSIKTFGGKVVIEDEYHELYDITSGKKNLITSVGQLPWTMDSEFVYVYDTSTESIDKIPLKS